MTDTGTRATPDGDDEQTDGRPGDVDGPIESTEDADGTTESAEDADGVAEDDSSDVDTSHLDDVDDGCGCAEVWEHLSEERDD